jgi:putative inorganic carbon (HCO3(-)) transporter
LSDLLAGGGLLIAGGASAAAILLPPGRARAAALLAAFALFPVLILGDQWHTTQIVDLRHDDTRIAALLALAAAAIVVLTLAFRRWPLLLPLAIVAALPFRVPLHAGGDTANLLVPLYLVLAGAVVATVLRDWTAPRAGGGEAGVLRGAQGRPAPSTVAAAAPTGPAGRAARWLPRVLAAVVVLYAVQTLYSEDFSKGLQNVCFFLVPFAVAYALLREVVWDRRLLRLVLCVVAVEALVFVLIGSVEYVTRDLFWNDQVIRSNEFHTYFRVNSVFWDPNVYGRYLALAIALAMATVLWVGDRRGFALATVTVAILWIGLAETFSQSSFIALLSGLAVLAALRWSWRWTLAAVAVGAVAAVLVVGLVGGADKINFGRINTDTSGRANLVQGGIDLFGERPLWGYGSGSFQRAYRDHAANKDVPVSISHTEPITVASEQGLIGLVLYVSLIAAALATMTAGVLRALPDPLAVGRAAVLAAFVALLVHTMAYAGFYEDPITWVLLAVGASLAAAPAVRDAT